MGTSKSYSGSGGKHGDAIRDGINDWLDALPQAPPAPGPDQAPPEPQQPRLDPTAILNVVALLRPRSSGGGGSDGPGGGGGGGAAGGQGGGRRGGGPGRSVGASAGSAGRAAAAAYAFQAGDAATLERLGLSYDELSALGDQLEVTRRIVDAACGPRGESTIEDHEQRLVAAEVAEWVLSQEGSGYVPTPEEIVRRTIAFIVADAALTEAGQIINEKSNAGRAEAEIRDAAEALAERATLSVTGATEAEFTKAIEQGIETLRGILNETP